MKEEILSEGDSVLLYFEDGSTFFLTIENKIFGTHKGNIDLNLLVGKKYGDTMETTSKHKFVILKPSIVDYIFKLKRRTQIVYPKDVGYIILMLDVKYGDTVIEAGTGSGSLLAALSRYVGSTGKVITYEKRREFSELAKKNLEKFGVGENVEFKVKDIKEGFDETDVDAVFIDVPDPWNCVENVYKAVKKGGKVGFLLPTTNQVQDLLKEMERFNFFEMEVSEILLRKYKVSYDRFRPFDRMVAHTAYLIFATKIEFE